MNMEVMYNTKISIFITFWFIYLIHPSESNFTNKTRNKGHFKLGILMPWTGDWTVGGKIGGAVPVAIQEIHHRQLLPGE